MEEPGKRFAAMMSGLDIHYGMGTGQGMRHPLLVRRMPDLDLVTASGRLPTFALLRDARPVLLNLGAPGAKYLGEWELPVRGVASAPAAVLIRPDGYVAWIGGATDAGLTDALTTWFGPPSARPGE